MKHLFCRSAAAALILTLVATAAADTVKGRGSINNPLIVDWLGNGPTQITITWKKTKTTPLMLVLGDSTAQDIIWCTSVGNDAKNRMIRCDFNAIFDFYVLAVGALSGSDTFEVTVTSDPLEVRTIAPASAAALNSRAKVALSRLADHVDHR